MTPRLTHTGALSRKQICHDSIASWRNLPGRRRGTGIELSKGATPILLLLLLLLVILLPQSNLERNF